MKTTGIVKGIVSNLVTVRIDGPVAENEICYINLAGTRMMAEVIKVSGQDAQVQVFESTRGLRNGDTVEFDQDGVLHFSFSLPGTYEYLIGADATADAGKTDAANYSFETRRYTVRFYIENGTQEGTLRLAGLTITESGTKKEVLELAPDYHGQPPETEPESSSEPETEPESSSLMVV